MRDPVTTTPITRRYIRFRFAAALIAVFVSALLGHELARRGRQDVDRAAAVAEALDKAHLAITETALALRELAAATDAQRAETRRVEVRRTGATLEAARLGLTRSLDAGDFSAESAAVLGHAALDPLAVIADLATVSDSLARDGGPFGAAAERQAFGGLGLARQLLPILNRLKTAERDALALAQSRMSTWSAAALALTAALLAALGLFVFLPLERRILAAQREIEEKRAAAEAASEAKSAFLATMSHEIRTPMNGVLGMAELLRVSELNDRQRRMAEIIASSGRALMAILDSVLQFSRIEAGRIALTAEPFEIATLVEEIGALFTPIAVGKGLTLSIHIDATMPRRLVGDDGAIRQVVTNLVSNAVKFTDVGGVALTLRDAGRDPGGRRFSVTVADTGVGVPPEAQARIFESFEQADASTTRRHGGAGLGLAITRGLVQAMGGEITLASAPGEGSRFTVTLALPEAAETAESSAA